MDWRSDTCALQSAVWGTCTTIVTVPLDGYSTTSINTVCLLINHINEVCLIDGV